MKEAGMLLRNPGKIGYVMYVESGLTSNKWYFDSGLMHEELTV